MNPGPRVVPALLGGLLLALLLASPGSGQAVDSGFGGEYRLVVGDRIQVVVKDHEELDRDYTVPATGTVSFPPLGKITLGGRTLTELETEITRRFVQEGELTEPHVFVLIKEYAARKAFLFGAVTQEIDLPVHTSYTLVRVLAMAGANPSAFDLKNVKIIRRRLDGQSFSFYVNVEDAIVRDDFAKDVVVMPDDIIYISSYQNIVTASYVYILGKVNTPGRYPFQQGREDLTLAKLIALAGDFTQFARDSAVKILRKEGKRSRPIVIDFDDIIEGEIEDFVLKPDDIVYVPESPI